MLRKSFSVFILITVLVGMIYSQEKDRPKIALVLSGGGAKGFTHIGVLKVLEEAGIPIDFIVGTSMGSIVGGLYSLGYTPDEIEQLCINTDWEKLFSNKLERKEYSPEEKTAQQRYIFSFPVDQNLKPIVPNSFFNGQNVINLLCGLAANVPEDADFNKFPVPYACVGTDIETGKRVVMENGFLPTAIYSSMSIPGVFMPVKHGDHILLDGGIIDNFPTDVAKEYGADIIIGVDLRSKMYKSDEIVSMGNLIGQLINFLTIEPDSADFENCDVLIQPDITGYSSASFTSQAVDTLIRRGSEATLLSMDKLLEIKNDYKLPPDSISRHFVRAQRWFIKKISLSGNYSLSEQKILNTLDLNVPAVYGADKIKKAIDHLYGLGSFNRIYYKLNNLKDGKELVFILDEKNIRSFNVGLRANSEDAIGILVNYTQKDSRNLIDYYSLTANLSSNPGFSLNTQLNPGNWASIDFNLEGKYKDLNYYDSSFTRINSQIYFQKASINFSQRFDQFSSIGVGGSENFYLGDIIMPGDATQDYINDKNDFFSEVYLFFNSDVLDNYYFPHRGTALTVKGGISINDEKNVYTSALLKMQNYFPLTKWLTFKFDLYSRLLLEGDYSTMAANFVGGHDYEIYFENHLPFYGLPSLVTTGRYTGISLVGCRMNYGNHHFSVLSNWLAENDEQIEKWDTYNFIWGGAIKYAYSTNFGPMGFTVAYSDAYRKAVFSFNLGLWF